MCPFTSSVGPANPRVPDPLAVLTPAYVALSPCYLPHVPSEDFLGDGGCVLFIPDLAARSLCWHLAQACEGRLSSLTREGWDDEPRTSLRQRQVAAFLSFSQIKFCLIHFIAGNSITPMCPLTDPCLLAF